jgi:hypothetical protein
VFAHRVPPKSEALGNCGALIVALSPYNPAHPWL